MQRVQDDHALLDPLLVKVIHPLDVSVEKLREGLRDLLRRSSCKVRYGGVRVSKIAREIASTAYI